MPHAVTELTTETQFRKLITALTSPQSSDVVTVIKFYFVWCPHCKDVAKPYEKMAQQMRDVVFANINIETLPAVSGELGINSGPTFVVFKGNVIVGKVGGADLKAVWNLIVDAKDTDLQHGF
jgi:thioredoxin 1